MIEIEEERFSRFEQMSYRLIDGVRTLMDDLTYYKQRDNEWRAEARDLHPKILRICGLLDRADQRSDRLEKKLAQRDATIDLLRIQLDRATRLPAEVPAPNGEELSEPTTCRLAPSERKRLEERAGRRGISGFIRRLVLKYT